MRTAAEQLLAARNLAHDLNTISSASFEEISPRAAAESLTASRAKSSAISVSEKPSERALRMKRNCRKSSSEYSRKPNGRLVGCGSSRFLS
jgi:hypothetical protein